MTQFAKRIFFFFVFFFILRFVLGYWWLEYQVKAKFPEADFSSWKFGKASWYSKTDKGIKDLTANGEKFDDTQLTCASWDYPFNQRLIVINILTPKWVACRVNDRGPHKRLRRLIDLTKTTFSKISNPKIGLTYVVVLPAGESEVPE